MLQLIEDALDSKRSTRSDEVVKRQAKKYRDSIYYLADVAEKIMPGEPVPKPYNGIYRAIRRSFSSMNRSMKLYWRGLTFKANFDSAKDDVESARKALQWAMLIALFHDMSQRDNAYIGAAPGDKTDKYIFKIQQNASGSWGVFLAAPAAGLRFEANVKLLFPVACVAMFVLAKQNALLKAIAIVAGVPLNSAQIISSCDGSLIVLCNVDFREDAIAAAKFVDAMVCGQAAKDLSSLGLGECRVLVAVAACTTTSGVATPSFAEPEPEGEYAYFVQSGASIEPHARGIKLDARHALAHYNLGVFLKDVRNNVDGAERMFRKAIDLDRSCAPPRWDLSVILETQRNDVAGAAELMEEFVRLGGVPGVDGKERLAELSLHFACESGHVDAVRLLLDKGANVNRANQNGATPLYIACWFGHVDVARLLLERDAEVDRARGDGTTPLYIACMKDHIDVARLLLEKCAEVDRAAGGYTPLLVAKALGHSSIVALLEEHQK